MSFPAGSAQGADGLLPQHLKNLVSPTLGEFGASFVEVLASFVSQLISDNVPLTVALFFFGARLLGLNKPDGGVRPIAVGCTLYRLAAKCLENSVYEEMGSLLFPLQVGYGTRFGSRGCCSCYKSIPHPTASGKPDVEVGFSKRNSIRRDVILKEVLVKAPKVYPLACPNGLTITPWAQGRLLIWDATCWDTMAASNTHIDMSGPGRVADMAARRKRETYQEILHNHHFVPAAVETMGSFGKDTIAFLHQMASCIQAISKDPLEYLKLCQRFSVCI